MEIRRPDANTITTFEEFADGSWEGRMYSLIGGRWRPPLPIGLEVPERNAAPERTTLERIGARHGSLPRALRSASVTRSGTARPAALEASPGRRAAGERPYWQLQREPWRLR